MSITPRLGLWILFLDDRSRIEEAHFLAAGMRMRGGVEYTGWTARLTGQWSCHWGPRCRDVQGVGICGSKDKHQWEYERLDGNLSQEVRLYHCRRNHRRETDLVRSCSAASLFRGDQASYPLQTGRHFAVALFEQKGRSALESLIAEKSSETSAFQFFITATLKAFKSPIMYKVIYFLLSCSRWLL